MKFRQLVCQLLGFLPQLGQLGDGLADVRPEIAALHAGQGFRAVPAGN
ncbi:hypothetical protein [Methylomonas rhizoryzae]|nr:hypothetical protein [Methylomonas rhizoryzae]